MIRYMRCDQVNREDLYNGFKLGFSDYSVPMTLAVGAFMAVFFGSEGNALPLSFVAFDGNAPVGVVFGGIRIFDGVRTMRCGALCVGPQYRKKGIGRRLMEYHWEAAGEENCRCLFLEVIKSNEGAVAFYEKAGYVPMNALKYYSIDRRDIQAKPALCAIANAGIDAITAYRDRIRGIHVNWQSDIACFRDSTSHVYLTAKDAAQDIGYIVMKENGKVEQIYVEPGYRTRGVGTNLLTAATEKVNAEKINICLPANAALECFLMKSGFGKGEVEQYEMYKPI